MKQLSFFKTCSMCRLEQAPDQFIRRTRIKHKPTKVCQSCRDKDLARAKSDPNYLQRQRQYAARNRDKVRAACRAWRQRSDTAGKSYMKVRSQLDPAFRQTQTISAVTSHFLKAKKRSRKSAELLGCPPADFRAHIERLFQPGMTWANYGGKEGWSIDHLFPLSVAAKHSLGCLLKAANYRNVRPMWRKDNKVKHTTLPDEWPSVEEFLLAASNWV